MFCRDSMHGSTNLFRNSASAHTVISKPADWENCTLELNRQNTLYGGIYLQVFLASPGGLSLEGFVAAMLPSLTSTNPLQRESSFLGQGSLAASRRRSATNTTAPFSSGGTNDTDGGPQGRRRSSSNNNNIINKKKKRKRRSSARGRRGTGRTARSGSDTGRGMETRKNGRSWRSKSTGTGEPGTGAGRVSGGVQAWGAWEGSVVASLSDQERIAIVTDLVELFQQVSQPCSAVTASLFPGPAVFYRKRGLPCI